MLKTKYKLILTLFFSFAVIGLSHSVAHAERSALSTYSWDPGLYATRSAYHDTAHSWGRRATGGAWGTGSVNYQAGSTTNVRANSSGRMSVVLDGTYCPGGNCNYGSGSGYKGLVQFWNDPGNYVAFGLIHDPGVSPSGNTIMIEGAAAGQPIGGYWPGGAISGASHLFTFDWTPSGIQVTIDGHTKLGPYPVSMQHPSISFLAAARDTGDICDTTFSNIVFKPGSIAAEPIHIPDGQPYATYSATIRDGGSGTGHSAYINMHDAFNNAIAVGIQTDTGSPESQGQPHYIWERVQNGHFTYSYLGNASSGDEPITLKWWKSGTAVFYAGSTPLDSIELTMHPRLFFNAEGNARLTGDSVNSTVKNVQISVGDNCPTYCGLNGSWNTSSFNFYGLTATRTNGNTQNGANFAITGTANLPAGLDWDTTPNPVAGIGMIAQYWAGQ